jgi:hypothetical protein
MNKQRRAAVTAALSELSDLQVRAESLKETIIEIAREEREYFDNMPEAIQAGEKGSAAEEAASSLESAFDFLDSLDWSEAESYLQSAAGE